MSRRIFTVRINLDDMAAQLDGLDSDADKLQWLAGFRVGSRGVPAVLGWSEAKKLGHSLGLSAHQSAVAYSDKQSAKGKARNMGGFNRGSAAAGASLSHGSATAQPIQYPISNIQKPITKSEQGESERDAATPLKKVRAPRVDSPESAFVKEHKLIVKGTHSDRVMILKWAFREYGAEDAAEIFKHLPEGGVWCNELAGAMANLLKTGSHAKPINPFAPGTAEFLDFHVRSL